MDGKQLTIAWHVDDLKISHASSKVVTSFIEQLQERYGKEAPLTITRGNKHEYLGMLLDYTTDGKVRIDMTKYINTILADLPDIFNREANTPAPNHLFTINKDAEKISEKEAVLFHHIVYQLLFLCRYR